MKTGLMVVNKDNNENQNMANDLKVVSQKNYINIRILRDDIDFLSCETIPN